MPIHPDTPGIYIIETHQQLHHRRFSCTGRPYYRHRLSCAHLRRKIMNDNLIRLIPKRHMLEAHRTLGCLNIHFTYRLLLLFLFLQELKHTLRSCRGGLEHVRHLGNLLNRLRKISDILEKGLDISYFNRSPNRHITAQNCHHHITDVSDKLHHRHHNSREELGLPARFVEMIVRFLKDPDYVLLFIKYLHYIVAAVDFFYLPIHFTQISLLILEIFLGMFHHCPDNSHRNRED